MQLHLIRHGQTDWNEERRVQGQSESRLTEMGIQQAQQLGAKLRHLEFDQVYCSSSLRTRQTAEHVFSHTDHAVEFMDELREIHLGPWEGNLYDDVESSCPDSFKHFWNEPHLFNVSGAETFYDLQQRAISMIEKIATEQPRKQIAIVSHGALIKSVLCHVENLPMEQLWTPPNMHNCAHSIIEFETVGIRRITQYADRPFSEVRPDSGMLSPQSDPPAG